MSRQLVLRPSNAAQTPEPTAHLPQCLIATFTRLMFKKRSWRNGLNDAVTIKLDKTCRYTVDNATIARLLADAHRDSLDGVQAVARLAHTAADSVWASNANDGCGLDRESSLNLCLRVFHGEHVEAEDLNKCSAETFDRQCAYLQKRDGPEFASREHVVHARREVIQHAHALSYLLEAVALHDSPLGASMLQHTHGILMKGIDLVQNDGGRTPWQEYGGVYRKTVRNYGTHNRDPQNIPEHMDTLAENIREDRAAVTTVHAEGLDPFLLAASWANALVEIMPFEDGNGRMSRLLLTVLLFRYAGVLVVIGGSDSARFTYNSIIRARDNQIAEDLAVYLAREVVWHWETTQSGGV